MKKLLAPVLLLLAAGAGLVTATAREPALPSPSVQTRAQFDASPVAASTGFVAKAMGYVYAWGSPQLAVDVLATVGGGTIRVPAGYDTVLTSGPLLMKSGVCVVGDNAPDSGVGLVGSSLRAAKPMASLIAQADYTVSIRNACVRGMKLDASVNVTDAAIDLAMISSDITDNVIQGPGYTTSTTGIRQRTPAGGFGWINHVSRNRVGGFGKGLDYNGSDSWIVENYISGNGVNVILNSTGSITFTANQIENSGGPGPGNTYTGTGLALANTATGATDRMSSFIVAANNFTSNGVAIEIPNALTAGFLSTLNVSANKFHDVRIAAIRIGSNNNGGLISANSFSDVASTATGGIVFTGGGQTGWKIGPNTFNGVFNPTPVRYVGLPADTLLLDDTIRPKQIVIDSGSFGYAALAPLAAYGNKTELGAAFTQARFGVAQNAAGFDAALLIRSINGSTPALDFRDGEQTQVADGLLMMNGVEQIRLRRGGGVSMVNLPASSSGLPGGALWRDPAAGNVLKVVPP